jgi:hypothetical protein
MATSNMIVLTKENPVVLDLSGSHLVFSMSTLAIVASRLVFEHVMAKKLSLSSV